MAEAATKKSTAGTSSGIGICRDIKKEKKRNSLIIFLKPEVRLLDPGIVKEFL
jgi:hypothetical protein